MQKLLCIVAITCMLTLPLATPQLAAKYWDHDVYTGRHFNLLVTSSTRGDDVIVQPAILVLYAPSCELESRSLKDQLRPWGPLDKYLTIAFHDYVTFPRHIWYKLDEADDLKRRYLQPGDHCRKVLYFEEGARLATPQVWDGMTNIYEWAWSKFLIQIPVTNLLDHDVIPRKDGQGDPWAFSAIEPWATSTVETHMGLALTFSDLQNTLLYAVWLEQHHRFTRIEITRDLVQQFQKNHGHVSAEAWTRAARHRREAESRREKESQWGTAENFLLCFKQPVVLPRFTQRGYFKTQIPPDVYSTLKTFYDAKKSSDGGLKNESMNSYVAINGDKVKTGMVELTPEVQSYVHDTLLNQMQDWCNCKLEETFFYGIREYYRGNVLRMHVDRIETHVISSILQIDQNLGDGDDWLLEVIDYHGDRQFVKLLPGEMLLYESATLIHGRPSVFNGVFFANCFLHYKPVSDWTWTRKVGGASGYVLTDGKGIVEQGDVINTSRTFQAILLPPRDEL